MKKVFNLVTVNILSEFIKRNNKKCILCITFFIVMSLTITIYAKYIIKKEFYMSSNSPTFYLDAQIDKNISELDMNKAEFIVNIQNYISNNEFNTYDTSYQITENSEKFDIEIVDENNNIISSGTNNNEIKVTLKALDVPSLNLEENVLIKLSSNEPYKKEINFSVKIINSNALIGQYVDYNVAYTDIFTNYNFSSVDGWRILDPGVRNEDGSYSNVKILTTGIPMKLYYNAAQNPATTTNQNSKWWGTVEQVNSRYGLSEKAWDSGKSRYYAAYGLEYNFALVPFSETTNSTKNKGYYTSITNDEATSKDTGAIFLTSNAQSVHAVTVEEMNLALNKVNGNSERGEKTLGTVNNSNDARAMFYLRGLNSYKYTSSTTPPYWLGSPNSDNTGLIRFQAAGTFSGGTDSTYGIRPVIVLNKSIYIENGIWKIKEN